MLFVICCCLTFSCPHSQVKKALELYEQLRQRTGVVVIGPSGSGKSTIWRLLRLALGKVGQTVIQYTMNPKAMPRTQVRRAGLVLLGHCYPASASHLSLISCFRLLSSISQFACLAYCFCTLAGSRRLTCIFFYVRGWFYRVLKP